MLKQQRRGGESAPTGGGDKSMCLDRKPTTGINHPSDFTESWSTSDNIDCGICVIEL